VIAALTTDGAWQGEIPARRKDGTVFDALLAANIMRDSAGVPVHLIASVLDVTEAKKLQLQFLQAQKMESVGRLAGGIAHDFNNLLTVINGCLELVLDAVPEPGGVRDDLMEISRAATSAAELTQQLLAFSRKQIISPQILDLGSVVQNLRGMLQRLIGEDILLEVITTPAGHVRFDPGQAEQILINLAVNARDAMPNGGRLTIETSSVKLDERYVRDHPGVSSGDFVLLAVSDTGTGMTPETLALAFEPFFTTKELGHGTGLGLAMIHGAVSQNGGRVEVYSELGIGTSFKIYLPRAIEPVSVPAATPRAALPRGTETIIVVEDEKSVRELIVKLLERQGYRVFAFGNGPEALTWVRTSADTVHMLITDVIMPGMNGKELAETVKSLRPAIRVLYSSGYTANVIVHHGVLKPGVEFIAKPFAASALATRVRDLLDAV
jgi:signal transduction histidine kinase